MHLHNDSFDLPPIVRVYTVQHVQFRPFYVDLEIIDTFDLAVTDEA